MAAPQRREEAVQIPDDQAFASFRRRCEVEQGWQQRYSKAGLAVWVQAAAEGRDVHQIKCRIDIKDVSAETMYDVLHDIEYRRKWDTNMMQTFDIARLTVNADVGYYSWRCLKPLQNRDVVTLRSWLVLDTDYMIINHSVKHPNYPPQKGLVRAVSILTGYLIHSTGINSCTLTYLAQADPKGSLPKWVVNKASHYLAPKVLKKLCKACMKYPEWKQKNKPSYKPWLNPEQSQLPTMSLSELSIQHADSLENIDESGLSEVKDGSDEEETSSKTGKA
ncbi:START domain-containing protein 10 [Callorhinchus milii]|uniref:START domain-containing protein 10 n=2 Tax=Callorhinchus milii TaxID=7868 RepID=A0A4W3I8S7_CALMI|nr:START domain-containing protein 10 [Callorhinchus milii]|eukprot:gi/632982061/ref/XP_007907930.1/ PREDICTED: PCTP-like protein [Callorhinchus milii]